MCFLKKVFDINTKVAVHNLDLKLYTSMPICFCALFLALIRYVASVASRFHNFVKYRDHTCLFSGFTT